jgi:hypothetical protein
MTGRQLPGIDRKFCLEERSKQTPFPVGNAYTRPTLYGIKKELVIEETNNF